VSPHTRPEATLFLIFGFAADLAWPKVVPALYHLFLQNRLPEHFDKGITGETW
jgi:glucose-6-phosphate 1-dehydrogenase